MRRGPGYRALTLLAVLAGALVAAASARADSFVTFGVNGPQPANVTVDAGEAIHWTNDHFASQSVTSTAGLFDSGPIPSGGGFSMAIHVPGVHTYSSSANPFFVGTIRVTLTELPGDPDDLVADAIPDVLFPPADPGEIATHPSWGMVASTRRILLGFDADATVGDVNDVLESIDARILGGRPRLGILLVEVPEFPYWAGGGEGGGEGAPDVEVHDLDRFSGLDAALQRLRKQPSIAFASMSPEGEVTTVPRRSDAEAEGMAGTWAWDDSGQANWGLRDARFPQAWNFFESIRRQSPSVVTGIVDNGFEQHDDLPGFDLPSELCNLPQS